MDGSTPKSRASRYCRTFRAFLATSLVAGFTLATGPVHAQSVITTDADGLCRW